MIFLIAIRKHETKAPPIIDVTTIEMLESRKLINRANKTEEITIKMSETLMVSIYG